LAKTLIPKAFQPSQHTNSYPQIQGLWCSHEPARSWSCLYEPPCS